VISAQFRIGGCYTRIVAALGQQAARPALFLLLIMLASAASSALLMNDVVCLALTPVLAAALIETRLNPVPFLLGLAMASNIGSAATIIGNPQNLLIGQTGRLAFGPFLAWCAPPALASLAIAYGVLLLVYRGRLAGPAPWAAGRTPAPPSFSRRQTQKAAAATALLVALFFTRVPREVSALSMAGLLLCSRRTRTRDLLASVDWHLLTLFGGLFVVVAGLLQTGVPAAAMAALGERGLRLENPVLLTGFSAVLSNLVSNVPAVMLLVRFLDPAHPSAWYGLALASTFAGNLIPVASLANLITLEQARAFGLTVSFREYARAGIPVTLLSLAVALVWAWCRGL